MKKVLIIVVTMLLLAAVPITVFLVKQQQDIRSKAAPATALTLKPAVTTKNVGDTISLDVVIDTGENLAYFSKIDLEYDPKVLEAESIVNGPIFPNVKGPGIVSQTDGTATITVGINPSSEPFNGAGIAATVKFKALSKTASPTTVKFGAETSVAGTDQGESKNLLTSSAPARITVIDTTPPELTETPPVATVSASPTLTPTPGGTSENASQSGDLAAANEETISPTPTDTTDTASASAQADASLSQITILSPTAGSGEVTATPLIRGTAPPNSTVTITIYSSPQTAVVTADSGGNWSYTPTEPLAAGPHDVVVAAQSTDGSTYNATESFVVAGGAGSTTQDNGVPVSGDVAPTLLLVLAGLILFGGGAAIQKRVR